MLEQFTTGAVLHYKVQIILIFNHLIQLNYLRMSYFLQNRYFSINTLDVTMVLNFIFFKDFNGHFVAGTNVGSLLDFAESSFTFCLSDYEATNNFALLILLLLRVLSFIVWDQVFTNIVTTLFSLKNQKLFTYGFWFEVFT